MKLCEYFLLTITLLLTGSACTHAQADGCSGAMDTLNRVKEQIVPGPQWNTPRARTKLTVMYSALQNATHLCPEAGELWVYRQIIAERLGDRKEADFARGRVEDLHEQVAFDPFTLPAAALDTSNSKGSGTGPHTSIRVAGKRWALVIGIDIFKDKRAPRPTYAVKDAHDFANYLQNPHGANFTPDHVLHVENSSATLSGIKQQLKLLKNQAAPDDLVVLFIASASLPREHDPDGFSYVLSYDSNLDDASTLYSSSLQIIDLVQTINRELRAQRVVLIMDTSYSGSETNAGSPETPSSAKPNVLAEETRSAAPTSSAPSSADSSSNTYSPALKNLVLGKGRAVLTANRTHEKTWDNTTFQNGYFAHFLLEVLNSSPRNTPLEDLFLKVQAKVSSKVQELHHASQTPSFDFGESAYQISFAHADSQ